VAESASLWWKLPAEVARRRDLTQTAKVVYAFLADCGRRGVCPAPGWRQVARAVGVEESTAGAALQRLEEAGLVVITRRGLRRSVVYQLRGPLGPSTPIIGVVPTLGFGVGPTPETAVESAPETGVDSTPKTRAVPSPDVRTRGEESGNGLSRSAIAFAARMKRDHGVRVTQRQLWPLNPAFVAGVPVSFAVEVARQRWHTEAPWDLGARLQREWAEVWAAVLHVGRYRRGLEPKPPAASLLQRAGPHLTPAQKLWANAEGPYASQQEPPGCV